VQTQRADPNNAYYFVPCMAAIACSAGLKAALARLEWSSPIWAIFPLAERRIVLEKKIQINRVPPPLLRSEIAQLEARYDSGATLKLGARTRASNDTKV
jgi:hypothetical protein